MKTKCALATAGILLGTGPAAAEDITIGVPNWAAAKAIAYLLESTIEEETALDIGTVSSTNPLIFEAMDNGDMDIHPDVWLPNQENLVNRFVAAGTVKLSENAYDGFASFCVTRATVDELGVTSIYDLTDPDIARQFDTNGDGKGEIWVGATGWAGTAIDTVRLTTYGVAETFELLELDESVAISRMKEATASGKPFATLCFAPHMMFVLADLVRLEEPAYDESRWTMVQPTDDPNWLSKSKIDVAYPPIKIQIAYATRLEQEAPRALEILRSVQLDTDTVNDWNYQIVELERSAEEVIDEWKAANGDRVAGWLGF